MMGTDSSSTVLADVYCSSRSSYLTITQCSFSTFISSSCTDSTDVTVTCNSTRIWDSPLPGDIRLTGGKYSNQGLLEVYCNGQWETVCSNDEFGISEATVACSQLGYNDYRSFGGIPIQGAISQPIWILPHNTFCSPFSHSCLINCGGCPSSAGISTACNHSQDVTLVCEYSSYNSHTTTAYFGMTCDTTAPTASNVPSSTDTNLLGILLGSIIGAIVLVLFMIFAPILLVVLCLNKKSHSAVTTSKVDSPEMSVPLMDSMSAATPDGAAFKKNGANISSNGYVSPDVSFNPGSQPSTSPEWTGRSPTQPSAPDDSLPLKSHPNPFHTNQTAGSYPQPLDTESYNRSLQKQPPPSYDEYTRNSQAQYQGGEYQGGEYPQPPPPYGGKRAN